MKEIIVIISSVFLLFISCGTNKNIAKHNDNDTIQYTLSPDYENFTLSWGYDNAGSDKIMGYRLYSNGKIDFYQQDRQTRKIIADSLTKISIKRVLQILDYTNNTYLYTPALSEPGKKCGFIELRKPEVNFYSKAKWNEHKTYGSKTFRQLFDTLLTLVPSKLGK